MARAKSSSAQTCWVTLNELLNLSEPPVSCVGSRGHQGAELVRLSQGQSRQRQEEHTVQGQSQQVMAINVSNCDLGEACPYSPALPEGGSPCRLNSRKSPFCHSSVRPQERTASARARANPAAAVVLSPGPAKARTAWSPGSKGSSLQD